MYSINVLITEQQQNHTSPTATWQGYDEPTNSYKFFGFNLWAEVEATICFCPFARLECGFARRCHFNTFLRSQKIKDRTFGNLSANLYAVGHLKEP